MKHLFPIVALAAVFATSCSNTVDLSQSDRPLVSPTRVKNEVGLPKVIEYVDQGSSGTAAAGAAFGLVGALVTAPIVANIQKDERNAIYATLGERTDKGAIILRDEFIKSLRRNKVAKVVDSGQKSELTLTITSLGLIPSEPARNNMQFKLEVEATLADLGGRVLWQTHYGSYPHNDQLPVRHISEYKADNELLRKDFALTCYLVSDLIIEDLKSQMQDEE